MADVPAPWGSAAIFNELPKYWFCFVVSVLVFQRFGTWAHSCSAAWRASHGYARVEGEEQAHAPSANHGDARESDVGPPRVPSNAEVLWSSVACLMAVAVGLIPSNQSVPLDSAWLGDGGWWVRLLHRQQTKK
jgi:hypothetical protein